MLNKLASFFSSIRAGDRQEHRNQMKHRPAKLQKHDVGLDAWWVVREIWWGYDLAALLCKNCFLYFSKLSVWLHATIEFCSLCRSKCHHVFSRFPFVPTYKAKSFHETLLSLSESTFWSCQNLSGTYVCVWCLLWIVETERGG